MDPLQQALTKSFEVAGRTFVFKRPNTARLNDMDLLAARYRGGMPPSSMTMPVLFEARAALNVFCIDPQTVWKDAKGFDFGDLDDTDLLALYEEVSEWVESFRKRVEPEQGSMGG